MGNYVHAGLEYVGKMTLNIYPFGISWLLNCPDQHHAHLPNLLNKTHKESQYGYSMEIVF